MSDPINPQHYQSHPSGVECIAITEHMPFCIGNAIKYLWRAGQKDDAPAIQDYEKAIWYIQREIDRQKRLQPVPLSSHSETEKTPTAPTVEQEWREMEGDEYPDGRKGDQIRHKDGLWSNSWQCGKKTACDLGWRCRTKRPREETTKPSE